jgi:hypothetical protein
VSAAGRARASAAGHAGGGYPPGRGGGRYRLLTATGSRRKHEAAEPACGGSAHPWSRRRPLIMTPVVSVLSPAHKPPPPPHTRPRSSHPAPLGPRRVQRRASAPHRHRVRARTRSAGRQQKRAPASRPPSAAPRDPLRTTRRDRPSPALPLTIPERGRAGANGRNASVTCTSFRLGECGGRGKGRGRAGGWAGVCAGKGGGYRTGSAPLKVERVRVREKRVGWGTALDGLHLTSERGKKRSAWGGGGGYRAGRAPPCTPCRTARCPPSTGPPHTAPASPARQAPPARDGRPCCRE